MSLIKKAMHETYISLINTSCKLMLTFGLKNLSFHSQQVEPLVTSLHWFCWNTAHNCLLFIFLPDYGSTVLRNSTTLCLQINLIPYSLSLACRNLIPPKYNTFPKENYGLCFQNSFLSELSYFVAFSSILNWRLIAHQVASSNLEGFLISYAYFHFHIIMNTFTLYIVDPVKNL